jgi:hypothetical protein
MVLLIEKEKQPIIFSVFPFPSLAIFRKMASISFHHMTDDTDGKEKEKEKTLTYEEIKTNNLCN